MNQIKKAHKLAHINHVMGSDILSKKAMLDFDSMIDLRYEAGRLEKILDKRIRDYLKNHEYA